MFTDKDFKDLFFDIHNKKNIMDMPRIKELDVPDIPDAEKILRYLVYMYDQNTPLIKERDLDRRKKLAAKSANFAASDKRLFRELSELSNEIHVELLFRMMRVQRNRLWCKIVAQEGFFFECYENIMKELKGGDDDKKTLESLQKKAKLSEEMDIIDDRLEKYYKQFVQGDEQVEEVIRKNSYSPEARILRNADKEV